MPGDDTECVARYERELILVCRQRIAGALENDRDRGSLERGRPQLEQKLGCLPPEFAWDLQAAVADVLDQHRHGDAQGRLPETVLDIEPGALAHQECGDVVQALI